jgi:cytochrome c-type biogenesis protein
VEAKIALAFAAGLLSFATPCVLPLVPGYLAAVSGAAPGVAGRRVVTASLPFVAGFTAVFVALGAAAAATGALAGDNRRLLMQAAGILVVCLGFAFMGLLPLPWFDRLAKPELVEGARRSGSAALLGAAFAVCAAPCVGPVLATILALASDEGTIAQGSFLLLVYSLGLALPFVLVGIGFARTMGAFRWLRDHYDVVRIVSGAFLVAVGLLLFFDRWWWLNVAFDRTFRFLGIGD